PIQPSSFRLPPSKIEPIPSDAPATPPPGSGGGRGVGPVENRRDRQPATVAAQNEPTLITRAQALAQRRAKLLRYYPPEHVDAILAGEQAMKR
ncbi:MAG: hypothetical protein ACYC7E_11655, partial [Armatimonadota bacterium]